MRPRFWYCPLCGYMFLDRGASGQAGKDMSGDAEESCPMCGEDAKPCWECIAEGVFTASLCDACETRAQCPA